MPAAALAEARSKERKISLLERLGPTRDVLKTILDVGETVSEVSTIRDSSEDRF